ncbi:MAG: L,D-transpeptidase family protein, partial [Candidatus Ornithomonoglobus sp.]
EKQFQTESEETIAAEETEDIITNAGSENEMQSDENENHKNEESAAAEEEQPDGEIDDFDVIGDASDTQVQTETEAEPETTEISEESVQPEETDEERAEKLEKRRRILKKTAKIGGIAIGGLAVIYLAGAAFYNSHFFFGTIIGSYNCSNMSLSKAEEHITTGINNYSFAVYEKNDVVEYIKGEDVGLATVARDNIEDIKAKQNPFMWPVFWKQRVIPMSVEISLDDELLKNKISTLQCVTESNIQMDGAVAGIYYDENDKVYHVADDGTHSIVSERALFEKISGGMKGLYAEMHLDEEALYGGLETDDRMNDTLWVLNNCLNAVVTYQHGEDAIVVDRGTIHTWLSVADDYSVSINDAAVASFVGELAGVYDTIGSTRTFMGSGGSEVSVSGGDYGWKVNQAQEIAELKDIILAGQPVTREPAYSRTAGSHGPNNDFPNTYVEVSIAAQHLWYYKNGELIISSDVVTGNPYAGNGTHTGTYYIKYKEKNATLVGDNYETPVSFWMPFNGGEGLHDATWRGAFGGRIYMGGGSHGCVNCPYSTAQTLFENLQPGDPVIVY